MGAVGVGELSDKGRGLRGVRGNPDGFPMHIDDPRMDPVLERCAELKLPVNIHVGEDKWMYEPMDRQNDGLMNSYKWRIPDDPAVLRHDEVIATLERAIEKHPRVTWIACHLANTCYDLAIIGRMFDRFPNLYADIGARFGELAPIPRHVNAFFTKFQDRILYGTDMGIDVEMYRTTFRVLETEDEHFYPERISSYHWAWHGIGLPDPVLKKIYGDNARQLFERVRRSTDR
jgi:predicted TIM-barrel fold metal-dependent hydrolase